MVRYYGILTALRDRAANRAFRRYEAYMRLIRGNILTGRTTARRLHGQALRLTERIDVAVGDLEHRKGWPRT